MPLDTRVIKAVGNLGSLGNARVEQPLPQVMRVFPSSYSLLDFYQRAALALRWSLGDFSPPGGHYHFFEEQSDEIDPSTYVIEATELISEVRFDLRGH